MITSEWPTLEHPERVPFLVQQVEYLRQAKIEIEVFAFRGNKNPLNYLRSWLKLRRLYKFNRFDLIHAQFGQSGILAMLSPLPLVVTYWGSDLHGIVGSHHHYTAAGRILRSLSRSVARQAEEVIVVSEHLAQFLPPQQTIHVIPHGIDFELFRPMPPVAARNQLGLPLDRQLVLFAADPRRSVKRHYLAQEAVKQVKVQFDVDLITLSGIPHTQVPLYMNACDVLVLTSKHEGSPTVVKEALACNLPIVSVNVGDVHERIGHVPGCIVCADDSPTTIAKGLSEVLRSRRRIRGRETITDLDHRIVTQRIIEVYHSALSSDPYQIQKTEVDIS